MEVYSIYSIDDSSYLKWQADLLDYSFKKAKQPGKLIRLCSGNVNRLERKKNRSNIGKTIFTPKYSGIASGITWPVMNKPGSLKYLMRMHAFNDDDVLIFLDPDMVFTKPWVPKITRGNVCGQLWVHYYKYACENSSAFPKLCPETRNECVMYPFAITAYDMKKIASDIEHFAREGYKKAVKLNLSITEKWMADMPAFQTAMIKHNLIVEALKNIGLVNNWENNNEDAPILHYCQPMKDGEGNKLWNKRTYKAWNIPPDSSLATNRVDKEVLEMLREKATGK